MRESPEGSRVCVIGAGFSGLAVARTLKGRGIRFVCLDRAHDVGGLWRYDGGDAAPAYQSLHLNTAREVTCFTGFPMPDTYPRFPGHLQVADYLSSFTDHFGLREHIEFDTEVVCVEPCGGSAWEVTSRDRTTGEQTVRTFDQVVVASGHHSEPEWPDPQVGGWDTFPGTFIHSSGYHDPSAFAGQKVVVVGIGNSACDIATELSRVTRKTFLSMRRGAHVVPKQMLGMPIDGIVATRWWAWMPFRVQRKFVEILLRVIRGRMTDFGLPEPDHRIFSAPVTVSDELLTRISHGHIAPKPMIDRIDGAEVHFTDGSSETADAVVFCTGYRVSFPFLNRKHVFCVNGQVALYRRVVAPHQRGLYFAGIMRPFGASTRLVESQAEWIADLVDGTAVLPGIVEMCDEVDHYLAHVVARFGIKPINSIQIDVADYLRGLREEREAGRLRSRPHQHPVRLEDTVMARLR